MQRQESTLATTPVTSDVPPSRGLPVVRVRWRTAVVAVLAALAAVSAAIVASAERDAWLRGHPPVPPLVGLTVEEAARLMVPLHFGLSINRSAQHPDAPVGVVLAQNPRAGRRLAIGSIVQVTASQGSGIVPRLRGAPVAAAARELEAVGLRLGKVQSIEDSASSGTVLEQFTPPGRRIDPNGAVDVLVSGLPNTGPIAPAPIPPSATSPAQPQPPPATRAAPSGAAPPVASPVAGAAQGMALASTHTQEGGARAGASSGQCSAHAERERAEVCHEPAGDRGTQPNVYRSEHRGVSPGP